MLAKNGVMQYSGAMYCDRHSDVTLEGNITMTFTSNIAEHGGAVCVSQLIIWFANNSAMMLSSNRAVENGGAYTLAITLLQHLIRIFLQNLFIINAAYRYGGALYSTVK